MSAEMAVRYRVAVTNRKGTFLEAVRWARDSAEAIAATETVAWAQSLDLCRLGDGYEAALVIEFDAYEPAMLWARRLSPHGDPGRTGNLKVERIVFVPVSEGQTLEAEGVSRGD